MNEFDKMVTKHLLPPYTMTYLISDNDIVTENKAINNKHIHPEIDLFNLIGNDQFEISQKENELLSITSYGYKSVLAIFQDKSIRTFINVDYDFIPSLKNKT